MNFLLALAMLTPAAAVAGDAEIVDVALSRAADGWRADVTLRHADSGWDHYADAWELRGPDGVVYGRRVLLHPHVEEQPFTRSLSGMMIPEGVREVTVHAHDTVHGWAAQPMTVTLPE